MSSPRHNFVSAKTHLCFGEDTFVSRRRHEREVAKKLNEVCLKSGEDTPKLDEGRLKTGEGALCFHESGFRFHESRDK